MSVQFYGGVEGGATNTTVVVYELDTSTGKGRVVGQATGEGSNHWLKGIPTVAGELTALLTTAKHEASLPVDTPLESLGLCMSGFEQEAPQAELIAAFKALPYTMAKTYMVMNDSVGSMFSVSSTGGLVVISGTGSIAQRILPDGPSGRCGGWGHMFGDEGSAYYIAAKAVRLAFRHRDGYTPFGSALLPDATATRRLIQTYFELDTIDDVLIPFYRKFDKAHIANLTRHLAKAASDGDAFCKLLFRRAGRHLGGQVRTLLYPSVSAKDRGVSLADVMPSPQPGEVFRCLCVGSVWKSYPLLRDGFVEALFPSDEPVPFTVQLVTPKVTAALGAAWKAAHDAHGVQLPLQFDKNSELLEQLTAPVKTVATIQPAAEVKPRRPRPTPTSPWVSATAVAAVVGMAALLARRRGLI